MNLPNTLSLIRICMIPLVVVMYILNYAWAPIVAVALFILAALTDFLDGYIARKYNMVTDLGKLLDPIADKVLVTAALFLICAFSPYSYKLNLSENLAQNTAIYQFATIFITCGSIVVIARELLISAVRQIAATKGVVVQANIFGKIKTVLQDITLPVIMSLRYFSFLLFYGNETPELVKTTDIIGTIGLVLFALMIVATLLSGVIYLVQNRFVFAENKQPTAESSAN